MIDKSYFEKLIKDKFKTKKAFADSLGIQSSSVLEWFERGVIPSKRIHDVINRLEIFKKEEQERLLGLPVIQTSYRAKYKDIDENLVSENIRKNTKFLSRTFFSITSGCGKGEGLKTLRAEIGENRDPYYVATLIRKSLDITNTTPFDFGAVNYILEKFGINVFLIPFSAFGLENGGEENRPLAFTSRLGDLYLVVCDSNRTMDEASFDLTHELVHIFTGLIGGNVTSEDECFIDHVTEELIYPRLFI